MNPDDMINFDDYLFVESGGIYEDYNSLLEASPVEACNFDLKNLKRALSMTQKPKLMPKPQTTSSRPVTPQRLSREPSTSNAVEEAKDAQLMSSICDSMIDNLKISKNIEQKEEILKNSNKEILNNLQMNLDSHINSFLLSTKQQLKDAFQTIKILVAENESLTKELKQSKTDYDVLKAIQAGASTSSQKAISDRNETHLQMLELESKNEKLNALYLDSSDRVRLVLDENNCLKLQLNEAKEELNKKCTEIDCKNSEIGELHERLTLLTCQSDTYKNDYEEQIQTINDVVAENETLKARIRSSNRESDFFSAELELGDYDMIIRCPICQVGFGSYALIEQHVETCQNV